MALANLSAAPFLEAPPALAEAGWLAAEQRAARARAEALGLPHRKVEAWRYTDLRKLARARFEAGDAAGADPLKPAFAPLQPAEFAIGATGGAGLEGVSLTALSACPEAAWPRAGASEATRETRPFAALAAGLAVDGLIIRVEAGAAPARPLLLSDRVGAGAHHRRLFIELGEGARAVVIETRSGPEAASYFTNRACDIRLGPGAHLTRLIAAAEGAQGAAIASERVALGEGARFESFIATRGGALERCEIDLRFEGPAGVAHLGGVLMLEDRAHSDQTVVIDHAAPRCESRQNFKAALADSSRAVAQLKARVAPGAVGSDARQSSRALLLSDRAEIDAKPELEIHCDDVACAHGATAGALDERELFYLRARGIPEARARAMLTRAFLRGALDEIADEPLRAPFSGLIDGWLGTESEEML